MRLALSLAVLVLLFSSCVKESNTIPTSGILPNASVDVEIYPTVTEPTYAVLGDPNSIFSIGERITIYAKYDATYEQVSNASLTILNENGDILQWHEMTYTDYPGTGTSSASGEYPISGYFSASFILNEQLVGQNLTVWAQVNGRSLSGSDQMPNAFSVRN